MKLSTRNQLQGTVIDVKVAVLIKATEVMLGK